MATRYWVGGSGTWDATSILNWSATSGGAPLATAPTASDAVIFDANSGTGTCTTGTGAVANTVTFTSSTLGLTLGASLTLGGTFTLTSGTLSLASFALSCGAFSSGNSNSRTINFGTGSITLPNGSGTIWLTDTSTNLTVSGTPVVNATYSGSAGTRSLFVGSTAAPTEPNTISFNISAGSDTVVLTGAGLKDVNFTGFSGTWSASGSTKTLYGSLTLSSGMTLAASIGTLTFAATSGSKTITTNGKTIDGTFTINGVGGTFQLQDDLTVGSTRNVNLTNGTLDLNGKTLSCGNFLSSNSNARTLAFGVGAINLTNNNATIWASGTFTNMTITGTPVVNLTYAGSVGTRAVSAPSTGSTEANSISFNVSSGTDTVTFSGNVLNLNFTGFSGTLGANTSSRTVYGDLTFSAGMTLSADTGTTTFAATSNTKTITTNGKTIDTPLTFNGVGGTFQFADALTQGSAKAFTITNGTVKLKAGTTNTVGSFATGSGTTQRFLQSTVAGAQATISDASGTNTATYLTIQDIAATGGATWNAFAASGSIDAGNNAGWNFGYTPQYAYEYPIKLRSFTERTRF